MTASQKKEKEKLLPRPPRPHYHHSRDPYPQVFEATTFEAKGWLHRELYKLQRKL